MDTCGDALAFARALLDPTSQGLYPDPFLLPRLNAALLTLRGAIVSPEVTSLEAVAEINGLPAGTLTLDGYMQAGGVLAGFELPLALYEKQAGATPEDYMEVALVEELPRRSPDLYLRAFEFRGGHVVFLGATQALDLEVRYRAAWPPMRQPADALPARGLVPALGFATASLVAAAMGQDPVAAAFDAKAAKALFDWKNARMHEAQAVVRRPRPFRERPFAGPGAFGWGE